MQPDTHKGPSGVQTKAVGEESSARRAGAARHGRLFVISAPSGAGKTSLVEALRERDPSLAVSVSHTTRKPRPHEQDGREYYFVSPQQFRELVARGAFLEHAQVFDHDYGTGRDTVQRLLEAGSDVILEIDWQGARQVRAAMPGCVTIFILPPSRQALEERLERRQTDSAAVIARRLRDAVDDMRHWSEFDYVVVNDDFEHAVAELAAVVAGRGEALRRERAALHPLIEQLLAG
ncbi:MAG TPA: guanylate kinase [Steroidobacteraceae bacterium]|nr:guanylate kinase [Steroidobacteraceae bacterium]